MSFNISGWSKSRYKCFEAFDGSIRRKNKILQIDQLENALKYLQHHNKKLTTSFCNIGVQRTQQLRALLMYSLLLMYSFRSSNQLNLEEYINSSERSLNFIISTILLRNLQHFCNVIVNFCAVWEIYIGSIYIGSFNRDTRNLLDHTSHVVKVTSVKFVVNCLVVYGKSPWKVIMLSNVCKS